MPKCGPCLHQCRWVGTVATALATLVEVEGAVEAAASVGDCGVVPRVAGISADSITRGLGQVLFENMEDGEEEIADACLTTEP